MITISKTTVLLLSAAVFYAVSQSAAAVTSATKLENKGYICFKAGPSLWTHCLKESLLAKGHAVPVMVFDGEVFLGTELLLSNGNKGQPCPQDNLDAWSDAGEPFFACHHFQTGHH